MKKPKITHLYLDERTRRLARMAAAQRGLSLSRYVTRLVEADAEETGVAELAIEQEGNRGDH